VSFSVGIATPLAINLETPRMTETLTLLPPARTSRPITAPQPSGANPVALLPVTEQPMIEPGQLWLVEFPVAEAEISALERHAVANANVVIYDRALADTVAAVLSLGGYAEPATGDGMGRCLQFARDGWSVARLIEPQHNGRAIGECLSALAARLGAAGDPSDVRITLHSDGHAHSDLQVRLDEVETLIRDGNCEERRTAVFRATSARAIPAMALVSGNGLAG
jgi:hypothetical protein